jgi:hypothetical protein
MASKSEDTLFEGPREHTSTTAAQVQELVAKARNAQALFESFIQEQVGDAVLRPKRPALLGLPTLRLNFRTVRPLC